MNNLVAVYRDIVRPRMTGLPMYNAVLKAEAVGFRPHDGRLCGVLVTPWFMNLVLLPGKHDEWSGLASGTTFKVAFPSGEYPCMLSTPDDIAPHLSLPLFTTVKGFADQEAACRVARELLLNLYLRTTKPAWAAPIDVERNSSGLRRRLSRRMLLRSWLVPKFGGE